MGVLRAEGINKSYRNHRALTDLSIDVPEGSVYGLLGPNGAGKTTLIRIINQILMPDSGQLYLHNRPIRRDDVKRIGYLPEERGLYKKMKVGEQAVFLARLKGMSRHDAIQELKVWFDKFHLHDWWNKKVEELSKGMAQKVQFIVTVLHRPPLLIFDEPFSGFDPINTNLLRDEILRLRDEGATVLFSTHNMESVEELCDHITLINQSHNVLTGPIDEVRKRFSGAVYDMHYKGNEAEIRSILPNGWTMQAHDNDGEFAAATISHHDPKASPNELLAALLPVAEIHSCSRRAEKMNNIFIRAVEESSLEFAQEKIKE